MSNKWEKSWSKLGKSVKKEGSAIAELFSLLGDPEIIQLAGGLPNPSTFPKEELKNVLEEVMEKHVDIALQYGWTQGYPILREELAKRGRSQGIDCNADDVIILNGSQQGLDILSRLLISEGDEIIVEEPTYFGALGPFECAGAKITGIPQDEDGIRTDLLEIALKERAEAGKQIKFLYLVPTFQNPSGVCLSTERREKVLELAEKYEFIILEDDPYGELRYAGEPLPLIKSFDKIGRVIYMSTFSKILAPGSRLAWVIADYELVERMRILREHMDLQSSSFMQVVVGTYCAKGYLEPHIKDIIPIYATRRQAMLDALEKYAPEGTSWTKTEGGFFIWCTFPETVNVTDLFKKSVENKAAFLPGTAFYADGVQGKHSMRLCFTTVSEEIITEGIKRIMDSLKSLL